MTIQQTLQDSGTRLLYCPGKDGIFVKQLINMLDQAQTAICISSFLIQQNNLTDAIFRAARKGVQIYLITSLREELSTPDNDLSDEEREHLQDHLDFLKQAKNTILIRLSDSFHAKYILIDPKSAHPQGMLMTCNLTTDPLNGVNLELATELHPEEIRCAFAHFVHGFWNIASHEYLNNPELTPKKKTPKTIKFEDVQIPATYNMVTTIRDTLVSLVQEANQSLFLSSWSFDSDHQICRACLEAVHRGVRTTVFTRISKKNEQFLKILHQNGADIYCHHRFHAKCIVADGVKGMLMTSNFTSLGLDSGFELGVKLDSHDSSAVYRIMSEISKKMTPYQHGDES